MRWKFAFGLASDDLFFVTTRPDRVGETRLPIESKVTTFLNEDEFLGHLIRCGLRDDQSTALALAVLLSVAKPTNPPAWTIVDLTQRQLKMLHLSGAPNENVGTEPWGENDAYMPAARSGSLPQFYDLLMQAPTALCMVMGAEYRYSFLNQRYAMLIGIRSITETIGCSALDKYDEVERRRLSSLLDRVYQTGQPYIGVEMRSRFHHEQAGAVKEGYFNAVCQPIANGFGEITGIMIQATDVTEMVLARSVRDHREQQLYRQWAQLEAIYSSADLALNLIDATDFRIIRVNDHLARLYQGSVAGLIGKPVMNYLAEPSRVMAIFARVIAGETVRNQIFKSTSPGVSGSPSCWLTNFSPVFLANGKVEAITVVSVEIATEVRTQLESRSARELVTV